MTRPSPTGTFDGSLSPVVEICEGMSCGTVVARFTITTGTGSEVVRVVPEDERYIVNWHTDQLALNPALTYRIAVSVSGVRLGHSDVDVVSSGKELKNVATDEFIGLLDGRTLPIAFRIEVGAFPAQPSITPTSGGPGTPFTLFDPQGRMVGAKLVVFTLVGAPFEAGVQAFDAVFSSDGTTVTGTVPPVAESGANVVSVHYVSQLDPPLFNGIPFTVY